MVKQYLPLVFSFIVAVTYYYSNKFELKNKPYGRKVMSFAAGVSITYILLELFPSFTEVALSINKLMFISILIGFIAHHLIEKEIYHHTAKGRLRRMLSLEENTSSFIYHFVVGFVLVPFVKQSVVQAVMFFIPILAYTIVSTLPMSPHSSLLKSLFLSSATPFGVLTSYILINIPLWIEYSLVGLVIGLLLFIVTRHHIPFGRKGEVSYFTSGFMVYSILIIISWYF